MQGFEFLYPFFYRVQGPVGLNFYLRKVRYNSIKRRKIMHETVIISDNLNIDLKIEQITSKKFEDFFENFIEKLNVESICQDLTLNNLEKSEQVKIGLIKTIDFIQKNQHELFSKFSHTDKIRIQRKSQKPFLPFSFEIHHTPEGWVLHVLLKTKGGTLNASGSQKKLKDSLRVHNGKCRVEVNITARDNIE